MNVPRKYPVFRVIALILKILAWVVLAAGFIGMIALLSAGSRLPVTCRSSARSRLQAPSGYH